jgi:predicted  nucleic acid-binding Zn-ribbon protein
MDSWSQSVHWSSLETSHKKEFDRLSEEFMAVKSHLQISLCKEADLQNNLNQLQDKEAELQNNLNQLQDVRIPALKSELELMQMELEAKGAETTSTKMQVSMLQDTIAELRGFLNDPDLKDDLNSNNTTMVETLQKEMEMERKSVLRLQLEAQHKDAEISQLSSQIAAMEHIVARSQKSIENLESQLSSDIQVHPLSDNGILHHACKDCRLCFYVTACVAVQCSNIFTYMLVFVFNYYVLAVCAAGEGACGADVLRIAEKVDGPVPR